MADTECSTCKVCATVTTGLEFIAVSECREKLHCNPMKKKGKVYFEIPVNCVSKARELRSVEHLFVVVHEIQDFGISDNDEDKETTLLRFYQLVDKLSWHNALQVWKIFTKYEGPLMIDNHQSHASAVDDDENQDTIKDNDAPPIKVNADDISSLPSFRVTTTRAGSGHKFSSVEISTRFGGALNDLFQWRVDLSNADIEVVLYVADNSVVIGIALTKKSLGKRNIQHFGPTTLKSSLAYCFLHLASIKPGDVVCDPMSGGGSIPIEAALVWPTAAHLCGDNHELAAPRALANLQCTIESENRNLPLDIFQWDICHLPLRPNSIDVMVTDMPFGKKSGNKKQNWTLYLNALTEMARVCPPTTGRVVILTLEKKVMKKCLQKTSTWWKIKSTLMMNMGGLQAGVYVLTRTDNDFSA